MFYDYRDIFESEFFQKHEDLAEQLAMQVLISVLKETRIIIMRM